ncbi:MAG: ATP-binding domain-containing protein [Fuscovulum sp.]|nr:MAG: ATP-binding domain-containing protein [Fuscovulum sp.]
MTPDKQDQTDNEKPMKMLTATSALALAIMVGPLFANDTPGEGVTVRPVRQHAFAISVHKAQRSQWRRVIIPIFPSRLLDRTLVYTAIARVAEQVILLGDELALASAIKSAPASTVQSIGLDKRLHQVCR